MGKKPSRSDARWAEAKKKCRLNAETARMAKELGLNPGNLIKNRPSPSQQWKAPVHEWVRDLYAERQEKAAKKAAKKAAARSSVLLEPPPAQAEDSFPVEDDWESGEDLWDEGPDEELDGFWPPDRRPCP